MGVGVSHERGTPVAITMTLPVLIEVREGLKGSGVAIVQPPRSCAGVVG